MRVSERAVSAEAIGDTLETSMSLVAGGVADKKPLPLLINWVSFATPNECSFWSVPGDGDEYDDSEDVDVCEEVGRRWGGD